jgi:hypothetical protein
MRKQRKKTFADKAYEEALMEMNKADSRLASYQGNNQALKNFYKKQFEIAKANYERKKKARYE